MIAYRQVMKTQLVTWLVAMVLAACVSANRSPSETATYPLAHAESSICDPCAENQAGIIFCDNFEDDAPLEDRYFEYHSRDGSLVREEGVGVNGSAGMRGRFNKGQVDAGAFKKSIGRSEDPYLQRNAAYAEETFTEIYWRIDVRYAADWVGGGADKLTRATMLLDGWKQGLIAHVWSGGKAESWNYMVIDPASGIDTTGQVVSTKYNDFQNLRWLGGRRGITDLFSEENRGKWHCVVAHVKLNTPGQSNGIFELWINDELQARRTDLNWHGTYNSDPENFGINAVFFENYWNAGSPVEQERYFDNVVISSKPIHCHCSGS